MVDTGEIWRHSQRKQDEKEITALRNELRLARGASMADDERLVAAALKAGIAPGGCDTPDDLADEILALRAALSDAHNPIQEALLFLKEYAQGSYAYTKPPDAFRVYRDLLKVSTPMEAAHLADIAAKNAAMEAAGPPTIAKKDAK